jgi:hypothetical protein
MVKIELLSNATTIDQALNYIRGKQSGMENHAEQAQEEVTKEQAVF